MSSPLSGNASEDTPLPGTNNEESTGLLAESGESAVADARSQEVGLTNNSFADDALDSLARQEWHAQLNRWQGIACLIAHALSLLGALLVMWWVHLLGGLSWEAGKSKQVFNWHPLLMVLAFCFMTVAALSFRAPYKSSCRTTVKFVHGSAWAVAAIFATVALIAVFKSHNDKASGFVANLYSLHSWLGMGMIGIYVIQFLAGVLAFSRWNLPPGLMLTPLRKSQILSIHKFGGPFLYMAVTATILLGIQEKEGFVKCSYPVDKADLFPLSHIALIPPACLASHLLGIVILAMALCTTFALHDFRRN